MRTTLARARHRTTLVCTALLGLLGYQSAHAVGPVVISQVYGGGGNTGATYTNDFIELHNRSTQPVSIAGWSVQYTSATGSANFGSTVGLITALPAVTLQPGQYLLVQGAAGGAGTAPLPSPDVAGVISLSSTDGKVALVTDASSLGCNGGSTPCSSTQLARIADLVGYGAADFAEDTPAPALSNVTAALRLNGGCNDSDSNRLDFVSGAPAPRNASSPLVVCSSSTTRIAEIQGAGHISPLLGQSVVVSGIVTAVRTTGFYMQDSAPDANPATSEGLFVFTSSAPTVVVGDSLQVAGQVVEFRQGGASSANLTITELSSPLSVFKVSSGNPLPPPIVLGAGGRAIPNLVIDDDATGDVETSGSFDPATDGIDFYESLEGMRVQINGPVAAGPTSAFGELAVLADGGAAAGLRTSRGGVVVRSNDFNPERLILDDVLAPVPVVDTGDELSNVTAIVDSALGNFRFYVTATPTTVDNGPLRQTTDILGGSQRLSIATYNVAGLNPNDSPVKFETIARQIVTQLQSPDILSLTEVADNTGLTDNGITDAGVTFQTLINAIALAGGPVYQYRDIAPLNDQDGGPPGGNIRIGFLFNPARVAFVDRPGGTAIAANAVVSGAAGPQLLYSPGRIAPTNPAWNGSRKPLAGEFSFNGKKVFVIGNHFSAKGGDDPLFGHLQPPVRVSEVVRNAQAAAVSAFVQQTLALDPQAAIVVLGDFNDYQFSDALGLLQTGGGLVNLIDALPEAGRYTYVFDGNSQALDHVLVSPSIAANGSPAVGVVHTNAEFANRVTDHDPIVVALSVNVATDTTPPVINSTVAGTLGANGWFVSDAGVNWTVADAESPVNTTTGCDSTTVTVDTTGTTFTCSATSGGGSASQEVTVKRDTTAPVAAATASPVPNAAGWNKTSVTVSYSGTDATSGIASCSASTSLTAEGANQTSSAGTCTDNAGNVSASASVSGIDIDKTLPVVSATPVPGPNASGWNTTAVTVSFSASDALSGVAADGCDAPKTVSTDGAGQSVTGTCRDIAGNQGSGTASGIDIDRTLPVAVATPTPAPNANGWNNTDVTVTFSATDGLSGSGVAACAAAVSLTSEASSIVSSGTCNDVAGNTSTAAASTTSIDKTAPSASIATPANGATYAQGATVNASYQCSDALATVAQCAGPVTNGAPIDTSTAGSKSFTVNALDRAGNASSAAAGYTVVALNDVTAPVIVPVVNGRLGANGWYLGNVSVGWSVSDPESAIASTSGCAAVTIRRDTASAGVTFTCVATSAGGTANRSIVIKRDATAPTIALVQPGKNATYRRGQVVLAQYSCQDGLAGISQCVGTVANGTPIDTRVAPGDRQSGESATDLEDNVEATRVAPGHRQFSVIATDLAGNVAATRVSYKVR